jgi:hypothetical protein
VQSLQASSARSGQLLAARAQALFTSDLSAHCEHIQTEVTAAIGRAFRTHGGIGGCAAEVAAAYGEQPETAARRMRWARAVIQGIDDFEAALDGDVDASGRAGRRYLHARFGGLPVLVTPELAAQIKASQQKQP